MGESRAKRGLRNKSLKLSGSPTGRYRKQQKGCEWIAEAGAPGARWESCWLTFCSASFSGRQQISWRAVARRRGSFDRGGSNELNPERPFDRTTKDKQVNRPPLRQHRRCRPKGEGRWWCRSENARLNSTQAMESKGEEARKKEDPSRFQCAGRCMGNGGRSGFGKAQC